MVRGVLGLRTGKNYSQASGKFQVSWDSRDEITCCCGVF